MHIILFNVVVLRIFITLKYQPLHHPSPSREDIRFLKHIWFGFGVFAVYKSSSIYIFGSSIYTYPRRPYVLFLFFFWGERVFIRMDMVWLSIFYVFICLLIYDAIISFLTLSNISSRNLSFPQEYLCDFVL